MEAVHGLKTNRYPMQSTWSMSRDQTFVSCQHLHLCCPHLLPLCCPPHHQKYWKGIRLRLHCCLMEDPKGLPSSWGWARRGAEMDWVLVIVITILAGKTLTSCLHFYCKKVSTKYHIIKFQMYSPLPGHRILLLLLMSFEVMATLCSHGSFTVSQVLVALSLPRQDFVTFSSLSNSFC